MEDWRSMAAAVSSRSPFGNPLTAAAREAIDAAREEFVRAAEVCGRFRQELRYRPPVAGDPVPYLPTAMDHVRTAILCTRSFSVSHAGSGRVFSLCTARIGQQRSAPSTWQRWVGHHGEAAAHAAMALRRLQNAWSHGAAGSDAVFVMLKKAPLRMSVMDFGGAVGGHAAIDLLDYDYELYLAAALPWPSEVPPRGFPLWDAWGHAAEQLLRRAADELAMARAALQQMHHAVAAEFFDACGVLVCPVDP